MSGEALGWARRQRVSGGLPAKAVLVLLADYCGDDHACWPSVPTIARELETTPRTVQRALRALETDGLVMIAERKTGKGRTTSNHITLDVACAHGGTARGAARGDTVSPVPPSERHPTPDTVSPIPPSQCHPQNLQLEPPLEPSSADAEDARAGGQGAIEGEAGFASWVERFMAAYPASGLQKANWPKTRTAFAEQIPAAALAGDGDGPETLIACAVAYAASALVAKGTFGAVNPVEFLSGERWRAFLPGTAAAQAVAASAVVAGWAGPIEVWDAVCADRRLGEAWAGSWLAPCAVEGSVVHPRTGVAADRLRGAIGALLGEHGLTIGDVRKGEV